MGGNKSLNATLNPSITSFTSLTFILFILSAYSIRLFFKGAMEWNGGASEKKNEWNKIKRIWVREGD